MPISLDKRAKTALYSLEKIGDAAAAAGTPVGDIAANVILVIDRSSSMEFRENQFYTRGEIDELSERVLGLSMTGLDPDKTVQVFPFHSTAYPSFEVNERNYSGAIAKWCKKNRDMYGTSYLAFIRAVIGYARKSGMLEPGQPPVFVVVQTDGGPNEAFELVAQEFQAAAALPIFWMFIGLGPAAVHEGGFLDLLDNMPGRVIDNVGKVGFPDISSVSDEDFYDKLLAEFLTSWLPAARAAKILTV